MRSITNSLAPFNAPSDVAGPNGMKPTVYIQSSDPADMQAQVAAVLAAQPANTSTLLFVDLAGGGDGHTFVCALEIASGQLTNNGLNPQATRMFFYMAADAAGLQAARVAVNPQIEALFSLPGTAQVDMVQTMLAGAAKGTRFMGCIVCTISQGGE